MTLENGFKEGDIVSVANGPEMVVMEINTGKDSITCCDQDPTDPTNIVYKQVPTTRCQLKKAWGDRMQCNFSVGQRVKCIGNKVPMAIFQIDEKSAICSVLNFSEESRVSIPLVLLSKLSKCRVHYG